MKWGVHHQEIHAAIFVRMFSAWNVRSEIYESCFFPPKKKPLFVDFVDLLVDFRLIKREWQPELRLEQALFANWVDECGA